MLPSFFSKSAAERDPGVLSGGLILGVVVALFVVGVVLVVIALRA